MTTPWTKKKEAELRKARTLVQHLESERRAAEGAVKRLMATFGDDVAKFLIDHADDVCDVLAPFDSGERCAKPPDAPAGDP